MEFPNSSLELDSPQFRSIKNPYVVCPSDRDPTFKANQCHLLTTTTICRTYSPAKITPAAFIFANLNNIASVACIKCYGCTIHVHSKYPSNVIV